MKCVITVANEIKNEVTTFEIDGLSTAYQFVCDYLSQRPNNNKIIKSYHALYQRVTRRPDVVLIGTCAESKYYIHKIKGIE